MSFLGEENFSHEDKQKVGVLSAILVRQIVTLQKMLENTLENFYLIREL